MDSSAKAVYGAAMTTTTWMPEWTLADRLRKIRRERHLSQDEFARLLDVKPTTYGAWETGRNSPDDVIEMARRVEKATGVPAAWTLGVFAPLDTRTSSGGDTHRLPAPALAA